jgi:hypothetical protein
MFEDGHGYDDIKFAEVLGRLGTYIASLERYLRVGKVRPLGILDDVDARVCTTMCVGEYLSEIAAATADLEDPPSSQIDPAPYGGRSPVRLFHERFADELARPGYEGPISVFAIQG